MKFVHSTKGMKDLQAQRMPPTDICTDKIRGTRKARNVAMGLSS